MRCLSCNYDLSNLPENRCPECGRGFDPENPRTFDNGVRRGKRFWLMRIVVIAVAAYAFAFLISLTTKEFRRTTFVPTNLVARMPPANIIFAAPDTTERWMRRVIQYSLRYWPMVFVFLFALYIIGANIFNNVRAVRQYRDASNT